MPLKIFALVSHLECTEEYGYRPYLLDVGDGLGAALLMRSRLRLETVDKETVIEDDPVWNEDCERAPKLQSEKLESKSSFCGLAVPICRRRETLGASSDILRDNVLASGERIDGLGIEVRNGKLCVIWGLRRRFSMKGV
jgi:hypothetical protein